MLEKITIVWLELVFLLTCWWVGQFIPEIPDNYIFPLLALAAFRGGRALADNKVFEWLRDLVGITVAPDSSGAGDSTVLPEGSGIRTAFANLIICPICSGTWFALATLVIYSITPQLGRTFIYVMAAGGVLEIFYCLSEFLAWGGRNYREQSGSAWMVKNRLREKENK